MDPALTVSLSPYQSACGGFDIVAHVMEAYIALYSLVYVFALDPLYGLLQMGVVLAIPLIALYDGTRGGGPKGRLLVKYAFYLYYPLHLLVLGCIRCLG